MTTALLSTRRRAMFAGSVALLAAACGDRPQPPPPAAPAAAPPPPPEPVLRTTFDGRPVISFAGLRYSVRPPLGWRIRAIVPIGSDNSGDDMLALAAPGANTDPMAADTQISIEAFRKSERAPSIEAKIDNIATDRRKRRADFTVENELPMALAGGRKAVIYRMRNIPSGDLEVVAFVDEGTVVAEMLLVTKTRAALDATLPLFREMVRTYQRLP